MIGLSWYQLKEAGYKRYGNWWIEDNNPMAINLLGSLIRRDRFPKIDIPINNKTVRLEDIRKLNDLLEKVTYVEEGK